MMASYNETVIKICLLLKNITTFYYSLVFYISDKIFKYFLDC